MGVVGYEGVPSVSVERVAAIVSGFGSEFSSESMRGRRRRRRKKEERIEKIRIRRKCEANVQDVAGAFSQCDECILVNW